MGVASESAVMTWERCGAFVGIACQSLESGVDGVFLHCVIHCQLKIQRQWVCWVAGCVPGILAKKVRLLFAEIGGGCRLADPHEGIGSSKVSTYRVAAGWMSLQVARAQSRDASQSRSFPRNFFYLDDVPSKAESPLR